jgi:hypothetical protein
VTQNRPFGVVLLALLSWLGASDFQAVLPALLLSGVILLYGLSQRARRAFGTA